MVPSVRSDESSQVNPVDNGRLTKGCSLIVNEIEE